MAPCKASTCWTERTKLEKNLIVALILIGAFALAIISAYVASILINKKSQDEKETSDSDKVCRTASCIFAAKTILENMDPTISPCESIYDFACGNFLKKKTIPKDRSSVYTLGFLSDKVMEEMKTVLEEPIQRGEPKAFQLMKKYYKTCMDMDAMEKNGLNTIRSILKDLGGWPILEGDNWAESKFDWKELSYKLQENGFVENPLFQVFVKDHIKNSSRRILYITNNADTIRQGFRQRSWTDNTYFQFMVDAVVLLGADKSKSIEELKPVFDLQLKLQTFSQQSRAAGKEMSVNQLQQEIPTIPWLDYINKLLAPHVTISGDEVIFVFALDYLKNLGSLLSTVSKRTLANHMIWNFVSFCAPYSNKALREAALIATRGQTGVATLPARWKSCVEDYTSAGESIDRESLHIGVGALFVRKYFSKKTKQDAQEMISNIQHSLQDTMKHIEWMDAKTRNNALDKLKAMVISAAYPEEFLDDKKLDEFYGDLNLDENDYLKSLLKLNRFDIGNEYRRLREPINRKDWISIGMTVGTVNAHYIPLQNGIIIPAAVLQDRLFDSNRPHYLNYGAIGFFIGHELTHGFDTRGCKYNKYGNEFDWWTPETKNLFLNKSQCFVEQYNKYVVPDLNLTVNGIFTLQENVADNGGIALSYKAYQELIKKQGAEKTLPNLNYTQNQLFWIGAANIWCSKARIERQKLLLERDVHSPDRFRIIGSLSNNRDFCKDFHCSSKSKMNPKQKCKLW